MTRSDEPPGDDLLREAFFRDRNVAEEVGPEDVSGVSMARRLLPRAAGVVGLLVVLDLILRVNLPAEVLLETMQSEPASYTVKVARFAQGPAPDVLVLGSSRVRDGVIPEQFAAALSRHLGREASVYNLGLVNAKVEEWASLVRTHFPDPAPRWVLLGVTGSELVKPHHFQYAARFLWRAGDLVRYIANTSFAHFKIEKVEDYLESAIGRAWYLFGQRDALEARLTRGVRAWLGLADAREVESWKRQADYVQRFVTAPDGFHRPEAERERTLEKQLAQAKTADAIRIPPRELELSPEIIRGDPMPLLEDIVRELQRRGCRVALFEMPTSPYLQGKSPVLHGAGLPARAGRPARPGFRQRVGEVAAGLGVPFLDFPPEKSFLSNALYSDVNHLTPMGAYRFTGTLFRRLRLAGFFEDA